MRYNTFRARHCLVDQRQASAEAQPSNRGQRSVTGRTIAYIGNDGQGVVAVTPLLNLCRQDGWSAQHLNMPAESHDHLVDLVIKELVACREAGHLDLTVALADEASRLGIEHQRISANRLRAQRVLQGPGTSGRQTGAPEKQTIATPGAAMVRKKPFLDLCRRSGWTIQFLKRPAQNHQDFIDQLIKELVASREAGELNLTVALADQAESLGIDHPRIAANRLRALRARSSSGALAVVSKGALAKRDSEASQKTHKTFWNKLRYAVGLSTHPRQAPGQLEALLSVCAEADWSPRFLSADALDHLAEACGREMQRCRQADQHVLVVALGTEAALQGLEHKRIQEHLEHSRRQAQRENVIQQVNCLLQNNPPAAEEATKLLVNALATEPDFADYRSLLATCVRQSVDQRTGAGLPAELLESTVQLEVNERLLEALQRRRQD